MDKEVYNGLLRKKKVEHIGAPMYICKNGDTLGISSILYTSTKIGALEEEECSTILALLTLPPPSKLIKVNFTYFLTLIY